MLKWSFVWAGRRPWLAHRLGMLRGERCAQGGAGRARLGGRFRAPKGGRRSRARFST